MKKNNKWAAFGKTLAEVVDKVAEQQIELAKLRSEGRKRVVVSWKRYGILEAREYSEQLMFVEGKPLIDYLVVVPNYTTVSGLKVKVVDSVDPTLLYDMAVFTSLDVSNAHRNAKAS